MNKLLSPEILQAALDLIAKGVCRPTKIAAGIGVAYRTYLNWMVRSNNGDPEFLVVYSDGTEMQWARAITLATRVALFELRGLILQEAIFGYDETQTKDGQIVWTLDPAASAMSEDERENFGFRRDALLEVDGKLVPLTIRRKAPFAQQARLLEAAFPDLRPTSTVNSNVNVKGMVGVGVARAADYSTKRPIPAAPPIPIAPPVEEADFVEVDDELADMIDGPSDAPIESVVPVDLSGQPPPFAEPEPAGVSDDTPEPGKSDNLPKPGGPNEPPDVPVPMAVDAMPTKPMLTPLQMDLRDRLAAMRDKPPKGDQPNV